MAQHARFSVVIEDLDAEAVQSLKDMGFITDDDIEEWPEEESYILGDEGEEGTTMYDHDGDYTDVDAEWLNSYVVDQVRKSTEGQPPINGNVTDTPPINGNATGGTSNIGSSVSQFAQIATATKKCRHAATEVFSLDGITYHGGSRMYCEDEEFDASWLVVCLLGDNLSMFNSNDPAIVNRLNPFMSNGGSQNWISIKWPDMQEPPLHADFWPEIQSIAKEKNVENVLFYCYGGHGRTGTALASMLVTMTGMDGDEAIDYIRENYCNCAVETARQRIYLTQCLLPEEPIDE